ncbi:alkaline phosphatase family protein [Terriglobus albidus]|uniref:alkaline phosphatase family protein n=1 Tax=Terriglobus albidus TaxID=1592106 RepID=UPI00164E7B87|nr:ectonucleotide pyrophosphatase/phosphodiesterase [Terriglobus albidus]
MRLAVSIFLSGVMMCFATALSAQTHRPVLMISIDGLRPDYVTRADQHGLKIPNLRRILAEGAHAEGVVNVSPTVTYPNHTTLVTGVLPSEHGIYNNELFDPEGKEHGGWYWYAQAVQAPTLWQAAKDAGLVTASVYWPVTVKASGIDYNIPEYFRQRTQPDRYMEEAVSRPAGMLEELEQKAGPFNIRNSDAVFDETVTRTTIAMIESRHPDFLTVHIVSLDHVEHEHGPFSPEANADLEKIDEMVGRIAIAQRKVHPNGVIAVVSDHGFSAVRHRVYLNSALVKEGFISLSGHEKATVDRWSVFAWPAGGTAMMMLRDKGDAETEKKVQILLAKLAADPRYGIAEIVSHEKAVQQGMNPDVAFVVNFKPGYRMAVGFAEPELEDLTKDEGTHGYMNTLDEMHSSFFVEGPGVAKGKNLGVIDMRQIAPTIAGLLGAKLDTAKSPRLSLQ